MGCDIRLFIEYKKKEADSNWQSFGSEFRLDRNYGMFGLMSKGVRWQPENGFEPKGMPDGITYKTRAAYLLYITDDEGDDNVTLEKAQQYAKYGRKIINNDAGEPTWVEHPDWHSHSWLTTNEFEQVIKNFYEHPSAQKFYKEPEYESVLAAMKHFEQMGYESRIVFWFDN